MFKFVENISEVIIKNLEEYSEILRGSIKKLKDGVQEV